MTPLQKLKIRKAFAEGKLKIKSVDSDSKVSWHVISDVMIHYVPHKKALEVLLDNHSSVIVTEDHSLFYYNGGRPEPAISADLREGYDMACVDGFEILSRKILRVSETSSDIPFYDLCVPGPENFVLENGILAHNSYSIGGISLDINKSSSYQAMKDNAEAQFEKAIMEGKKNTVKYIRGLQQPKYGMGVRSAFGPHTGRGILSPRNFV